MTVTAGETFGGASTFEFRESDPNCIDIGLVNNMPDAALAATERQFRALLDAAADGIVVRLRLFALPDVPRSEMGRAHVSAYADIAELRDNRIDGLIVTGTEPQATNLKEEPYWRHLAALVDWAEEHTYSTVWSCLAAHAAVLHLNGIERRRLANKRFGVFDCACASDHPLTAPAPLRVRMPHSRWNDLPEDALLSAGYRVLLRSAAGVDAFVKERQSLFIFFQGHPEYEAETLWLEYRRDVKRFLRHERKTHPLMPQDYFDRDTVAALTAIQQRALSERQEDRLAEFPTDLVVSVTNTWRSAARSMYRNWLMYLCAQKRRQLRAA